jgi:hypothetical protein
MIGATRTWAAPTLRLFERSPPSDGWLFDVDRNGHLGQSLAQIVNGMAPNIKHARRSDGMIRDLFRLPGALMLARRNKGGGKMT